MRYAGGAIIRHLYKYIRKLHQEKMSNLQKNTNYHPRYSEEQTTINDDNMLEIISNVEHDLKNRTHIECVKLTKEYNNFIENYRKQIEAAEPKTHRAEKKSKKNDNNKKNKSNKSKSSKKATKKKSKKIKKSSTKGGKSKELDWVLFIYASFDKFKIVPTDTNNAHLDSKENIQLFG